MLKRLPAVLLLACVPVISQQTSQRPAGCKYGFAVVYHDERLPMPYVVRLTRYQSDWWAKSGWKKYKDLCLDNDRTDYLIVWAAPTERIHSAGDGSVISTPQSFLYITRLSEPTKTEDALKGGKPDGVLIYEENFTRTNPGSLLPGPFSLLTIKEMSTAVLERAVKVISKLKPSPM